MLELLKLLKLTPSDRLNIYRACPRCVFNRQVAKDMWVWRFPFSLLSVRWWWFAGHRVDGGG